MNTTVRGVSLPSNQFSLKKATFDPNTNKIIEGPICLTKEKLSSFADLELTRLQEAVVSIGRDKTGWGSAVIISPDGLAVTNKHVAEHLFGSDGLEVKVIQPTDFSSGSYGKEVIFFIDASNKNQNENFSRNSNGNFHIKKDQVVDTREFTADLLSIDPTSDLALIRINKIHPQDSFSFVSFEEADVPLKVGDESYTLGHPFSTKFNVLRRGEIIEPINDLHRSIFQARQSLTDKTIPDLNSTQESQLEKIKTELLNYLEQDAKRQGLTLTVNSIFAEGDSGGLQANPEGQLRGINTAGQEYEPNVYPQLGIKHYLPELRMISFAVPAQKVLDLISRAGVNINSLLRGQEVGVTRMRAAIPPKNS